MNRETVGQVNHVLNTGFGIRCHPISLQSMLRRKGRVFSMFSKTLYAQCFECDIL